MGRPYIMGISFLWYYYAYYHKALNDVLFSGFSIYLLGAISNSTTHLFAQLWNREIADQKNENQLQEIKILKQEPENTITSTYQPETFKKANIPSPPPTPPFETRPNLTIAQLKRIKNQL